MAARKGKQSGRKQAKPQQAQQRGAGRQQAGRNGNAQSVIELLKSDHRNVEDLFAQFEKAQDNREKQDLVEQICDALIIHTALEEEIFYPACREGTDADDALDAAQVEHDAAKVLIMDLLDASPEDDFYDAKVKVLTEEIRTHIQEEEKPRTGVMAKAKSAGIDTADLAQQLLELKDQLQEDAQAGALPEPQIQSLHLEGLQPGMSRRMRAPMRAPMQQGRGISRSGMQMSAGRSGGGRFDVSEQRQGGRFNTARAGADRYLDEDENLRRGRGRSEDYGWERRGGRAEEEFRSGRSRPRSGGWEDY